MPEEIKKNIIPPDFDMIKRMAVEHAKIDKMCPYFSEYAPKELEFNQKEPLVYYYTYCKTILGKEKCDKIISEIQKE